MEDSSTPWPRESGSCARMWVLLKETPISDPVLSFNQLLPLLLLAMKGFLWEAGLYLAGLGRTSCWEKRLRKEAIQDIMIAVGVKFG